MPLSNSHTAPANATLHLMVVRASTLPRWLRPVGWAITLITFFVTATTNAAPPFSGTIFIDPDIITEADPTAFLDMVATGRGVRQMYDRRVNGWVNLNAFLFEARFDDGPSVEIEVNPEFGTAEAAKAAAERFPATIGRLPKILRRDLRTVWIHQGNQSFGGGNNNLLIYMDQADAYVRDGILEETFVHEASHTSLDPEHAAAPGWLAAQAADPEFISAYARDNPTREDIAESFLPYLAVRYRAGRISKTLANSILAAIPHRLAYFDQLAADLHPWRYPLYLPIMEVHQTGGNGPSTLKLTFSSNSGTEYTLEESDDLATWRSKSSLTATRTNSTFQVTNSSGVRTRFYRVREQ